MQSNATLCYSQIHGWQRTATIVVALLLCFGVSAGTLLTAKSGAKQSAKFRKQSEEAREAIEAAKTKVQETIGIYNSLMTGEAKKPEDTLKDLTKSVEGYDKLEENIKDRVEDMKKEADDFFQGWQEELSGYSNEEFRAQSQKQLEAGRKIYDQMIARMGEGRDSYQPYITSLKDQIVFLGRDLSPDAISHLQEAAAKVNKDATTLIETIDKILSKEVEDESAVDEIGPVQENAEGAETSEETTKDEKEGGEEEEGND